MNMLLPAELRPFRLTIEDYELLDRAGAFGDQRVELIEGMIVAVNAEMMPHTRVKNNLMYRFRLVLEALNLPLTALVEPTLFLSAHNMPEPDVLIADATNEATYLGLEQVRIVIEVGATTLRGDLGIKREMYAEQGVPEYWVVDVGGQQIHQFWSPTDGVFTGSAVIPLDGELRSATMPDLAIDGAGIL